MVMVAGTGSQGADSGTTSWASFGRFSSPAWAETARPVSAQPRSWCSLRVGRVVVSSGCSGSPGMSRRCRCTATAASCLRRTEKGSWSASLSRAAVGVDFRHPVMTRHPRRWATSRCSRFDGAIPGIQPAAAYSAQDLTKAVYTVRRFDVADPHVFPLRALMVLVLFAILAFRSSVCCRKESVLSNLTPRNVGVASCCSCTASSLSWLSRFASLGSRVKIVPTVFSVLIVIFQVSAHFFSSFSAVWTFASASVMLLSVAQTARSSAKSDVCTPGGKWSVMSLMKVRKSSGEQTAPCGVPSLMRRKPPRCPL